MPAIITHHLFGEEVFAEFMPLIGWEGALRDAFLLGNQGPDPLFCMKMLPQSVEYRKLGTIMHRRRPEKLFEELHEHCVDRGGVRRAFALGFLCHYVLDSTVHPLVYAQTWALCNAGVEGLTRESCGAAVHALIETEFDEYLLTKERGVTVSTFVPHRAVLRCSHSALVDISYGMSPVVAGAYNLEIPQMLYASSVIAYRGAQVAIDSKRNGLRRHVDYARLIGDRYLHVLALSHDANLRDDTAFANHGHSAWPHPFEEGEVITESFDELYERALERALALLPEFVKPDFSVADCPDLASGLNFRGQFVSPKH